MWSFLVNPKDPLETTMQRSTLGLAPERIERGRTDAMEQGSLRCAYALLCLLCVDVSHCHEVRHPGE